MWQSSVRAAVAQSQLLSVWVAVSGRGIGVRRGVVMFRARCPFPSPNVTKRVLHICIQSASWEGVLAIIVSVQLQDIQVHVVVGLGALE